MSSSENVVDLDGSWQRDDRFSLGAKVGCREARPAPGGPPLRAEERELLRTIESEIVPRLLLSHQRPGGAATERLRRLGTDDVAELTRLVVAHDTQTAWSFVDAVRSEGVSLDALRFELLIPSARLLGELWAADRCSFAEVSIGLSCIQRLARVIEAEEMEPEGGGRHERVLLAPVPGEQHTLGIQLVADFLRRDGWVVTHLPDAGRSELLKTVQRGSITMVALSVSYDALLAPTESLIRDLRCASKNPGLLVIVGGACFERGDNLARVGADVSMSDPREVVKYMRKRFERELFGH